MVVFLLNTAFFSGCGGEGFCGFLTQWIFGISSESRQYEVPEKSFSLRSWEWILPMWLLWPSLQKKPMMTTWTRWIEVKRSQRWYQGLDVMSWSLKICDVGFGFTVQCCVFLDVAMGAATMGREKKGWAVCRDGRKRMQGKQNWTDS